MVHFFFCFCFVGNTPVTCPAITATTFTPPAGYIVAPVGSCAAANAPFSSNTGCSTSQQSLQVSCDTTGGYVSAISVSSIIGSIGCTSGNWVPSSASSFQGCNGK